MILGQCTKNVLSREAFSGPTSLFSENSRPRDAAFDRGWLLLNYRDFWPETFTDMALEGENRTYGLSGFRLQKSAFLKPRVSFAPLRPILEQNVLTLFRIIRPEQNKTL